MSSMVKRSVSAFKTVDKENILFYKYEKLIQ